VPVTGQPLPATGRVFYGWFVVGVLCFVSILDGGFALIFSAFLRPLSGEFGWTRAQTSGGFSLYMAAAGCALPFWGWLADRRGARIVFLWSALIDGVALLLLSRVRSLGEFYAWYLLLGVGLGGVGPATVGKVVSEWFVARRGLAMGVALAGGAAGGLLLVPLAGLVIAALGWSAAYQVLAGVALGGMLPLVWFLLADSPRKKGLTPLGEGNRPERTDEASEGPEPELRGYTLREALGRSTFWWLGLAFCLGSVAAFGVTTHQVAFLQDAGLGLEWASTIAGLTLGVTTVGRLLVGWASGRTDRPHRMLGACLVVQAAGVATLLQTDAWGLWAVAAFALLFGMGFGGFVVLYPLCVGHDFGLRAFGAIAALLGTVGVTLGGAVGPVVVGLSYDDTGSYFWAFLLCAALLLVAAAVAFATSETTRSGLALAPGDPRGTTRGHSASSRPTRSA
jgi:sugar phosphate permease